MRTCSCRVASRVTRAGVKTIVGKLVVISIIRELQSALYRVERNRVCLPPCVSAQARVGILLQVAILRASDMAAMSVAVCLSSMAATCRVTAGRWHAVGTSHKWSRTKESEPTFTPTTTRPSAGAMLMSASANTASRRKLGHGERNGLNPGKFDPSVRQASTE